MLSRKPAFTKNKVFRFIASVRFAIPVLFVFAAAMAVGTVCESLYGSEFVRRAVYHTWWFYLIQFSMGASVLLAMLDRIPLKKRLAGFYVIHTALLVIMGGSVITHYWGIDGTIELREGGQLTRGVRLSDDYLYLSEEGRQHSHRLPDATGESDVNGFFKFDNGAVAHVVKYLPYAEQKTLWVKSPGSWGASWLLKNDRFDQTLELSDAPGGTARADLGPLKIELADPGVLAALEAPAKGSPGLVLLDTAAGKSYALPANPGNLALSGGMRLGLVKSEKMKLSYYELRLAEGKTLRFFPRFSPKPVTKHLEVDDGSPYRLLDLGRFGPGNTVLIARAADGRVRLAMGKGGKWSFRDYEGKPAPLPWMGFTLTLLEQHVDERPAPGYVAARPNRDDEKNTKAVLVRMEQGGQQENVWVTNREAARSALGLSEAFIGAKEFSLPFSLRLDRFKMELVPGTTDKPASYESFVEVAMPGGGTSTQHIFMNHPYKAEGYTFYQASYLQDDEGAYHSILSVNKDPGRPVKYAGSLLLIAGLIVHFLIIYGFIRVKQ